MKTLVAAPIAAAFLLVAFSIGCGGAGDSQPTNGSPLGAITTATFGELPVCWFGRRAQVYYVTSTEQFLYCDGRRFVELDLGAGGGGGTNFVVNVAPASLDECPNGGALISSGPDANGDGVVDSVASSQSVCDGMDGTSCTVSRDDASATTTITCDDGTEAVVADGAGGPQGPPGEPGGDGTSCSVDTDATGVVTISCDDGTAATIPPGGGSSGVDLVCELLRFNPSLASNGELSSQCPKAESCPCFDEEDVLTKLAADPASVTGCVTYTRDSRFITETIPGQNGSNAAFEASLRVAFPVDLNPNSPFATASRRFSCDTGDGGVFTTTYEEFNTCASIIEGTVGPCSPVECLNDFDCADENSCTNDACDLTTFSCSNTQLATGSSCTIDSLTEGQCFLGRCQPVQTP
ncbi:MAG: hypothetical protein WBG86_06030 [Polyangiales bacterium]